MHNWRELVCQRLAEAGIDSTTDYTLVEELAQHLEDRFNEERNRGASDKQAFSAALAELEGRERMSADLPRSRAVATAPPPPLGGPLSSRPFDSAWHDIRYGLRMLRKHPWISVVAVLTLGLGIGVNGVVFSAVHGVLLTQPPYRNSDRLVVINSADRLNQLEIETSFPDFSDWRARNHTLEQLAAVGGWIVVFADGPRSERLDGSMVSADFFPTLGVEPQIGRTLSPRDHAPGSAPVVVISYAMWARLYGMNPNVIGRTVVLNGESYTIVGVMPKTFQYPRRRMLWAPLEAKPQAFWDRSVRSVSAIGLRRSEATLSEVRREFDSIATALAQEFPATNQGIAATVTPLNEVTVGRYQRTLLILQCAVAFVLLIACANLANLLLAQTVSRRREFGIRVAIGASRGRLVMQLLSESAILSAIGGGVGFLFALWTLALVRGELADNIARGEFNTIGFNAPVMGMMALATILTALIVGLTPALAASKPEIDRLLREGGRGGGSVKQRRLQSLLVISEISLATMLLVGSGLMIRTVLNLTNADAGFRTENILILRVSLPEARYSTPERILMFYKDVEARVRGISGVESFAAATFLPLVGYNRGTDFRIAEKPQDRPFRADIQPMSPDYFKVVGMTVQRGRSFGDEDWEAQPEAAIVNGEFLRRFYADGNPIGANLLLTDALGRQSVRIVGIVNDVHQFGMYEGPRPEIYVPTVRRVMYLTIGTKGNPRRFAGAVREQVEAVDPEQTVLLITTFDDVKERTYSAGRILQFLLSILGAIALVMVTMAIYAIISYSVTQQSHEFGVRMALGSSRSRVLALVLQSALRLTLLGVLFGAIGAAVLSQALQKSLYEVRPVDPITYAAVALVVCLIALVACYLPARRATRVDPLTTLRCD